jgi:hypothetical protein
MRTDRALEKLRAMLARRGITSSAAALGTLVSAQSGLAAPAGLAASIAPVAITGAAGTGAAAAAVTFIVSTKTIITAASVAAALGLGFYLGLARSVEQPLPPAAPMPEPLQALAALRQENARLKAEAERLSAANAALTQAASARPAVTSTTPPPTFRPAPLGSLAPDPAKVPALTRLSQQRAILNNLRMIAAARDQFFLENKRAPASLDEIVGPTKYIKALNPVVGESYAGVALDTKRPLIVGGPDGAAVTYDPAGPNTTDLSAATREANAEAGRILTERFGLEFMQRVQTSIRTAHEAYRAANDGKSPQRIEAVIPYFATPQEGADFVEFSEAAKALGMKL